MHGDSARHEVTAWANDESVKAEFKSKHEFIGPLSTLLHTNLALNRVAPEKTSVCRVLVAGPIQPEISRLKDCAFTNIRVMFCTLDVSQFEISG